MFQLYYMDCYSWVIIVEAWLPNTIITTHLQVSLHSRNWILTRMFTCWGWVVSQYPTYYTYSHSSTESSWMVPQYKEQARLMHINYTQRLIHRGEGSRCLLQERTGAIDLEDQNERFPGQENWTLLITSQAMSAGQRRLIHLECLIWSMASWHKKDVVPD